MSRAFACVIDNLIISQKDYSAAMPEREYLLGDAHNNTRLLTDANGAIAATYDYDAYGELRSGSSTGGTRYLYNGQQFDSESGLYSLRARHYDPSLGRFLTQDPYTGNYMHEFNRYVYAMANPVMFSDPSGLGIFNYGSLKTHIKATAKVVGVQITGAFRDGAIAGVAGHIIGVFLYHLTHYMTHDEWLKRKTIDLEEVVRRSISTLMSRAYEIPLSALFGGILGIGNYLTGTALKGHFIERFAKPDLADGIIRLLIGNVVSAFVINALVVTGFQNLINEWASSVNNSEYTLPSMSRAIEQTFVAALTNSASAVSMFTNAPPKVSIGLTTATNAFVGLMSRAGWSLLS